MKPFCDHYTLPINSGFRFQFQVNFLGFIFQKVLDSVFKLQKGGILDSDLSLQGPINC